MKGSIHLTALLFTLGLAFAQNSATKDSEPQEPTPITIIGYVRDSACVYRFHEVIKPLPNGCVEACARGGSPLVVLTKGEQVYHPISPEMPDTDVRPKLLPFLGKLVKITGHVYSRGNSNAIALEQIQTIPE